MEDNKFFYEDDITLILCDDTDHIFFFCKHCNLSGKFNKYNVKIKNNQIKLH